MYRRGWIVFYLAFVPLVLCSLNIIEQKDSGITCSQSLSDCVMTDGLPFDIDSVRVTDLSAQEKLCCSEDTCALCLLIHMEVELDQADDEEDNSGLTDNDGSEETANNQAETGSVTVCYKTPELLPTCKKVEFTVNQARPSQRSAAQISMIITNASISYGSKVFITLPDVPEIIQEVNVPSLQDVCSSDISIYVQEECDGPRVNFMINKANQVELYFPGSNSNIPNVCLRNETNGTCQKWDRKPIPLEYVTPCTCFEAWKEDGQQTTVRSRSCPFKNNTKLRRNVWKNLAPFPIVDDESKLWWNVSAPCRLEGEVWPCERTPGPIACTEKKGFRQQLGGDLWRQNRNNLWVKTGFFAQISLQNHPCVMIKVKEMKYAMGPFCYNNINRWRWTLFIVGVMLLLSLTLLITFCLRDFIKKSVRSWRHGDFVNAVHKAHVLVLSPPDSDEQVSAAVCSLGSLLCSRDFSVTVDQWSRKGQLNSGPLPWSHCQLLKMDSQCERVVLFLTPKAIERAQIWSSQDSSSIDLQEESPYSDVFRVALFAIQAYKNQGGASERFALVTFDPLWADAKVCHNKLPDILRGLPLFHFPSQTKALLSNLCTRRTQSGSDRGRRTWPFFKINDKNQEPSQESETKLLQQS